MWSASFFIFNQNANADKSIDRGNEISRGSQHIDKQWIGYTILYEYRHQIVYSSYS